VSRRRAATRRDALELELTGGNIRNNHIYLRGYPSFFPPDCVGAPSRRDGEGRLLTIWMDGFDDPIRTDIAGGNKLLLRKRAPIGRFFHHHQLLEGDAVRIERLGDDTYRISPVHRRPSS
jgi:hypothetical protein